ncbi:MAG: SGNH/GDSL hydrolase family protein [Candidatus Omnitrophica bacterium]|nr:SGNH/GDSL hydrolase family protein [Candidatus Omnitrophota bacterium]
MEKIRQRIKEISFIFGALIFSVIVLIICLEVFLRFSIKKDIEFAEKRERLIKTNGSHLRMPLPPSGKEAGEFRIVALGDSFTWGDGIEDYRKTWPEALQERLTDEYAGKKKISVVNMGICGFTSVNEFELFARVGKNLNPDMIIIQYLINDILPSGPNFMRVGSEWRRSRKCVNLIRNKSMHTFMEKKSYAYYFLNKRFIALQMKIWPPSHSWEELYADGSPEWAAFKKALLGIRRLSEEKGIKTLFVIFPTFPKGRFDAANFPEHAIYAKVEDFNRRIGYNVLNLLPLFLNGKRDMSEWRVNRYDGHPSEEAHSFAAEKISGYIIKEGLIK